MTTYVLVHGAWSGAHVWARTRRALQDAGHEVWTPSLTGLGERIHLTGPLVGLTTHIHDVVNHVLYEDLDAIVLVGHSYGGMVVTGAVRHLRDRIEDLVYLDAFVPGDGDSVRSLGAPAAQEVSDSIGLGIAWSLPDEPRDYDDAELGARLNARRTPQPSLSFAEAVRLDRPLAEEAFRLTFIKATGPRPAGSPEVFAEPAALARNSPRWGYAEIRSGHAVPQEQPEKLAELLMHLPGR